MQKRVREFLNSKESLAKTYLSRGSGLEAAHAYSSLVDRFVRSLFLEAGFRERTKESGQEPLAVAALGGYEGENSVFIPTLIS